jgi:hypothetical protein
MCGMNVAAINSAAAMGFKIGALDVSRFAKRFLDHEITLWGICNAAS